MSMVMVTHDVDEAVYLSDYIIVMTPRPAKVEKIIKIEMSHPRARGQDVFLQYRSISYPKVIIADEPSSNLDSEQAEKIMDIFKSLAEKGKTVLIVTHDEKSASVCDEKFVLEEGMFKKSLILSGGVD